MHRENYMFYNKKIIAVAVIIEKKGRYCMYRVYSCRRWAPIFGNILWQLRLPRCFRFIPLLCQPIKKYCHSLDVAWMLKFSLDTFPIAFSVQLIFCCSFPDDWVFGSYVKSGNRKHHTSSVPFGLAVTSYRGIKK